MIRIDNPWVCASSLVGWALIGWFLVSIVGCGEGGGGGGSEPASQTTRSIGAQPGEQPDMLTATAQGLLRGKANGQGQRLIFSRSNLHQPAFAGDVFLANGLAYYPREAPSIILDYPNQDIWSVRVDGLQDHAVLNTTADEFVKGASGNVAIYEQGTYTLAQGLERTDYGSLRDGSPLTTLPITERFTQYRFLDGSRAFFDNQRQVVSTNADGSGLTTHVSVNDPLTVSAADAFGNTLVFTSLNFGTGTATIQATPISGGGVTSLSDGQAYTAYAGHVGSRVVFHRCQIDSSDLPPRAGPCDVVSVNSDGSGAVELSSDPANEAVQGFVGNQVIIRRNINVNDPLVAVPVGGGSERLLMTMTDNEFVQLVVGDRLVVRRPSGTWLLDMQGTLTQLGTVAGDSGVIAIGDAVCVNRGAAVWCMPLDGSGQAVRITDAGKVLGAA